MTITCYKVCFLVDLFTLKYKCYLKTSLQATLPNLTKSLSSLLHFLWIPIALLSPAQIYTRYRYAL